MSAPRPLAELLAGLSGPSLDGDPATPIAGLALDSRRVGPGFLFAALRGQRDEGMRHLPQALAAGAAAVLADSPRPGPGEARAAVPARVAWIQSQEPRRDLAHIARNFHGRPDERLVVAGVTGTNGKTTVATLLAEILSRAGHPAGMIGTVCYRIGERTLPADRTTPEAPELHALLSEMAREGCTHAVLEVSSHALALDRVAGLPVRLALFTNLTRDHLDFHGDLASYAAAKRRLFAERLRSDGVAVAGADDPHAEAMLQAAPPSARRLTFGFAATSDVLIERCTPRLDGTLVRLRLPDNGAVELKTMLPGRPGALNLAAAAAAAIGLGLSGAAAARVAAKVAGIPGRFERVDRGQEFAVIVDYAHTDDALETLLATVREMKPKRLITVFGCGGDRDRTKRAPMGHAAIRNSDEVVLTSDNPRSEDPAAILREVEAGILSEPDSSGRYRVLPDRREAIFAAIASAGPGDAVVIAGKGHEREQILADRTVPFDDREIAAEALEVRVGRPH